MIVSALVGPLQCENPLKRHCICPHGLLPAPSMLHGGPLHAQRRPVGREKAACRDGASRMCIKAGGRWMGQRGLRGVRGDVEMMWDVPRSRVGGKRQCQWMASSVSASGSHKDDNDAVS